MLKISQRLLLIVNIVAAAVVVAVVAVVFVFVFRAVVVVAFVYFAVVVAVVVVLLLFLVVLLRVWEDAPGCAGQVTRQLYVQDGDGGRGDEKLLFAKDLVGDGIQAGGEIT